VLDETIRILQGRNFTRGEGQADRRAIGLAYAKHFWDHTRLADEDQIQHLACTVPELRIAVVGSSDNEDVNRELDDLSRQLLPQDGIVQHQLNEIAAIMGEDQVVLCAARINRDISNNGAVTGTMRTTGRFVSSDPDIVERHYLAPGADRAVTAMASYRGRVILAGTRVPELAARQDAMITATKQRALAAADGTEAA
jgi:hypothetical protein